MLRFKTAAAIAALSIASLAASADARQPKNIIVMIADGAGYNALQATRLYTGGSLVVDGAGWSSTAMSTYPLRTSNTPGSTAQDPNAVYSSAKAWDTTPVAGNSTVPGFTSYPAGFQGYEWTRSTYPDSGNTATSMSTGVKTYNNAINVDGAGTPLLTLAEVSHNHGKGAGVVTTVQFGDATPAAFGGAHNINRGNRTDIANEMFSAGVLDVIGGTGNPDFDDNGNARAPDYRWITAALWSDLKNGTNTSGFNAQQWALHQSRADIQALANGTLTENGKLALIAQADQATNAYRLPTSPATEKPFDVPFNATSPTLSELSLAALNHLNQDPQGLYLMIEGGAVDRAEHADNTGRMIEEYIEFNTSVQSVIDWVNSASSAATWDDTLLIVTADHDHNLWGPDSATVPFQELTDNGAGNVPGYRWLGASHSNNLVPLFAYGKNSGDILSLAHQFDYYKDAQGREFGRGNYTDQTDLGKYLLGVAAATVPEPATWALMIGGFGMVGATMRRRRLTSTVTA